MVMGLEGRKLNSAGPFFTMSIVAACLAMLRSNFKCYSTCVRLRTDCVTSLRVTFGGLPTHCLASWLLNMKEVAAPVAYLKTYVPQSHTTCVSHGMQYARCLHLGNYNY